MKKPKHTITRKLFLLTTSCITLVSSAESFAAPPPPPPPPPPPSVRAVLPHHIAHPTESPNSQVGANGIIDLYPALFIKKSNAPVKRSPDNNNSSAGMGALLAQLQGPVRLRSVENSANAAPRGLSLQEQIAQTRKGLGEGASRVTPPETIVDIAKSAQEYAANATPLLVGDTIGASLMKGLNIKDIRQVEQQVLRNLTEADNIKSRLYTAHKGDWNDHLSFEEKKVVASAKMMREVIANTKKSIKSEKLRISKEEELRKKNDPTIIAEREVSRVARQAEAVRKADAMNVPLADAKRSRNFNTLHNKLLDAGKAQLAARNQTIPHHPTISLKLLKKLVQRDIVPTGMDMFKPNNQLPKEIKEFKKDEAVQLRSFLKSKFSKEDLKKLNSQIKEIDSDNQLSIVSEAISEVSRDEALRPQQNNSAFLKEIQQGLRLKKVKTQARNAPDANSNSQNLAQNPARRPLASIRQQLGASLNLGGNMNPQDVVTLESAKQSTRQAWHGLQRQGQSILLDRERDEHKRLRAAGQNVPQLGAQPSVTINEKQFKLLVEFGVLPTPEDMFSKNPDPKITTILQNAKKIRIARFKETLALLAKDSPQEVEAIMHIIGNEKKELARELRTGLSNEDIEILAQVEQIVENLSDDEVARRKDERTELARTVNQAIAQTRIARNASANNAAASANNADASANNAAASANNAAASANNADASANNADADEGSRSRAYAQSLSNVKILSESKARLRLLKEKNEAERKAKEKLVNIEVEELLLNRTNITDSVKRLKAAGVDINELLNISNKEIEYRAGNDDYVSNSTEAENTRLHLSAASNMSAGELSEVNERIKVASNLLEKTEINNLVQNTLLTRIKDIGYDIRAAAAAAGDDDSGLSFRGVWIAGIYGTSKQKAISISPGYNSKSYGAAIGFDFDINDNIVLGFSYSKIDSKFRFKNLLSGDKMNADSNVFSLYNKTDIKDNLMFKGIISYSDTLVHYGMKRLVSTGNYKITKAKFKTKNISALTSLAYRISTKQDILVLPTIGLKYNNQNDGRYSESGAGLYNLSVSSKKLKNLSLELGIDMAYTKRISNDTLLTPFINISIERNIFSKLQNAKTKLTWSNQSLEQNSVSKKGSKYAFNIGAGISLKKSNLEMAATYDCNMKKKYIGHQGGLKLRLNF